MKESLLNRLDQIGSQKQSLLCVGIDPDPSRLPRHFNAVDDPVSAVRRFALDIVAHTAPYATAFKFNFAFFEALGGSGLDMLQDVLKAVPADVITIADAKRGDIGNSASFYAKSVFDWLGFDFVTLSPYMGSDSVVPFLEYESKGVFILARTSNPGGSDFQNLIADGRPLYEHVAHRAMSWSEGRPGTLGFVTGATDLMALANLRRLCPNVPFLVPGVGAQGGDPDAVVSACGSGPVLVNSSRQIIYASAEADFASRAQQEARQLAGLLWTARNQINEL